MPTPIQQITNTAASQGYSPNQIIQTQYGTGVITNSSGAGGQYVDVKIFDQNGGYRTIRNQNINTLEIEQNAESQMSQQLANQYQGNLQAGLGSGANYSTITSTPSGQQTETVYQGNTPISTVNLIKGTTNPEAPTPVQAPTQTLYQIYGNNPAGGVIVNNGKGLETLPPSFQFINPNTGQPETAKEAAANTPSFNTTQEAANYYAPTPNLTGGNSNLSSTTTTTPTTTYQNQSAFQNIKTPFDALGNQLRQIPIVQKIFGTETNPTIVGVIGEDISNIFKSPAVLVRAAEQNLGVNPKIIGTNNTAPKVTTSEIEEAGINTALLLTPYMLEELKAISPLAKNVVSGSLQITSAGLGAMNIPSALSGNVVSQANVILGLGGAVVPEAISNAPKIIEAVSNLPLPKISEDMIPSGEINPKIIETINTFRQNAIPSSEIDLTQSLPSAEPLRQFVQRNIPTGEIDFFKALPSSEPLKTFAERNIPSANMDLTKSFPSTEPIQRFINGIDIKQSIPSGNIDLTKSLPSAELLIRFREQNIPSGQIDLTKSLPSPQTLIQLVEKNVPTGSPDLSNLLPNGKLNHIFAEKAQTFQENMLPSGEIKPIFEEKVSVFKENMLPKPAKLYPISASFPAELTGVKPIDILTKEIVMTRDINTGETIKSSTTFKSASLITPASDFKSAELLTSTTGRIDILKETNTINKEPLTDTSLVGKPILNPFKVEVPEYNPSTESYKQNELEGASGLRSEFLNNNPIKEETNNEIIPISNEKNPLRGAGNIKHGLPSSEASNLNIKITGIEKTNVPERSSPLIEVHPEGQKFYSFPAETNPEGVLPEEGINRLDVKISENAKVVTEIPITKASDVLNPATGKPFTTEEPIKLPQVTKDTFGTTRMGEVEGMKVTSLKQQKGIVASNENLVPVNVLRKETYVSPMLSSGSGGVKGITITSRPPIDLGLGGSSFDFDTATTEDFMPSQFPSQNTRSVSFETTIPLITSLPKQATETARTNIQVSANANNQLIGQRQNQSQTQKTTQMINQTQANIQSQNQAQNRIQAQVQTQTQSQNQAQTTQETTTQARMFDAPVANVPALFFPITLPNQATHKRQNLISIQPKTAKKVKTKKTRFFPLVDLGSINLSVIKFGKATPPKLTEKNILSFNQKYGEFGAFGTYPSQELLNSKKTRMRMI